MSASVMSGCHAFTAMSRESEARGVQLNSEYAITINKLERQEANFDAYRRVTFYNVRLGEVVFVCEGYCHVQIDRDGDVEIVVKADDKFYHHYLGQKQDITYFSEQLEPTSVSGSRYQITWNPNLWLPEIKSASELN